MNTEITGIAEQIAAVERLGALLVKSGILGDCDRAEQGVPIAWECIVQGKSPLQLVREYHLIGGRLSDRADSMLAKFQTAGGKFRILVRTPEECAIELTREGQTWTSRVTWDELQREAFVWSNKAGPDGKPLPKRNYSTPRLRMQTMWARVVSDGVRTIAPAVVAGLYTPEEIADEREPSALALPAPVVADDPIDVSPVNIVSFPAAQPTPAAPTSPQTSRPVESQPDAAPAPAQAPPALSFSPLDLGRAIAGIEDDAVSYLVAHNHLPDGATLEKCKPAIAARVIKYPDQFRKSVELWRGKKS
jgi:hypothetical protein